MGLPTLNVDANDGQIYVPLDRPREQNDQPSSKSVLKSPPSVRRPRRCPKRKRSTLTSGSPRFVTRSSLFAQRRRQRRKPSEKRHVSSSHRTLRQCKSMAI